MKSEPSLGAVCAFRQSSCLWSRIACLFIIPPIPMPSSVSSLTRCVHTSATVATSSGSFVVHTYKVYTRFLRAPFLLRVQLIRATLDEGVEEGRLLLKDWLVILLTYYNEQLRQIEAIRAKQRDQTPPPHLVCCHLPPGQLSKRFN
jgi:hypothetical protein